MKLIPKFKGGGKGFTDTNSNYSESVDDDQLLPDFMIWMLDRINGKLGIHIPTGASNCTLEATGGKYSKANSIINGTDDYNEIKSNEVQQGDLIIATNPSNNSHHTMTYSGKANKKGTYILNGKKYNVNAGDTLVNYSNGSTYQGYRENVPLKAYIDQSHGKTKLQYFKKTK